MKSFWLIGLLLSAFACSVHAQPLARPEPPISNEMHRALCEELKAEARTRVALPEGAEFVILGGWDGACYLWSININDDIGPHLDALGVEPADDRFEQFVTWCESVQETIHALTIERVTAVDPHFNPETEYTLEISGTPLPYPPGVTADDDHDRRWFDHRYASVDFRGSQMRGRYRPDIPREQYELPINDPSVLEGVELTVRIALDKSVIDDRTALHGTAHLTNTGTRRFPIDNYTVRHGVQVLDEAGEPVDRLFCISEADVTPDFSKCWTRHLMPGDVYEERFTLHSDDGEMDFEDIGFDTPPGAYTVSFEKLRNEAHIPTKVIPAPYTVVGDLNAYRGPRMEVVAARGDALIVFRDGGWIESIDPMTGARHGATYRPAALLNGLWPGMTAVFSADGRTAAYGSSREKPITWETFGREPWPVSACPMTGDMRPIHENGGTYVLGFGPDGDTLFIENDRGVSELSLTTGKPLRTFPLGCDDAMNVTPDGRHLVTIFDPMGRFASGGCVMTITDNGIEPAGQGETATMRIIPTDAPDSMRTVAVKGCGEMPLVMLGRNGAYLTHGLHKNVTYVPYAEGEPVIFETGHVSAECESMDGSLVAFASPGGPRYEEWRQPHGHPTTIEIWDVASRTKLYEIPGDHQQRARFVGDPATLVILHRDLDTKPRWYLETIRLHDARTGEFLREVDITPTEPFVKPEDEVH
jgi:hypothetical protein